MPIGINDDVLGLEVPVQDALGVQVLDCQQSLNEIEFGFLLLHLLHFPQQIKQLPPIAVLHPQNNEPVSFQCEIQLRNEGMALAQLQYLFFVLYDGLFGGLKHELLVDYFDRHQQAVHPAQHYLRKSSRADAF